MLQRSRSIGPRLFLNCHLQDKRVKIIFLADNYPTTQIYKDMCSAIDKFDIRSIIPVKV